jgi:hypothetical protein
MVSLSVTNRIGGVMVSVFTSRVVDRGFESRSGQTKDCKIGICCFSTKQATLRRKSKDWLARNQDNVSGVERHAYSLITISKLQWEIKIKVTKEALSLDTMCYIFMYMFFPNQLHY